jgi:hypothetical protein
MLTAAFYISIIGVPRGKAARSLALRGLLVLLAIVFVAACGGGSEEEETASGSGTSTPKASASRTPARTPTATVTPAPETAAATPVAERPTNLPQVADTPPPTQAPAPTAPPAPVNQAPYFPDPFEFNTETNYEYDDDGFLTGAVTTISIPNAVDPDGDALSYSWSVSSGSISGAGTSATWNRVVDYGSPQAGTVTVSVSDGRGGSDTVGLPFT